MHKRNPAFNEAIANAEGENIDDQKDNLDIKEIKFDAKKHNKATDSLVDMVIERKEELTKNNSKDNDRGGKEQNTDNKYKQWALQARKQLEQYDEDEDEEMELNYSTKNKNKLIDN